MCEQANHSTHQHNRSTKASRIEILKAAQPSLVSFIFPWSEPPSEEAVLLTPGTVCIPGSIGFRQPLAGVLQVRTQELVPLLVLLVQPHKRSRAPPPGWF